MTPMTDTTGHPDVTELSDLIEGLLPPSRTAEIQRHLDECEPCAETQASLTEIQSLLGTLPGPVHMPDDVVRRIDAALATEAAAHLSGKVPGEAGPTHVSRETSAQAVRTGDHPAGRPAGRSSAPAGPGRKERRPGRRHRNVAVGAVLTAALLGGGSVMLSSLTGHNSATTTTAADTFAKERLQSQVAELLAGKQGTGRGSDTQKPWGVQSETDQPGTGNSPKIMIQPSAAVPGCVLEGIHRGDAGVLAVKKGTYDGRGAYLVVLPASTDTTRVTAYVVDASCQKQRVPGRILLTESYDRP